MILVWKIRYLDSRDRHFKDRDLWLDTDAVDPVSKAAIELCCALDGPHSMRKLLLYRHLFTEEPLTTSVKSRPSQLSRGFKSCCLVDYFEDENGKELTRNEMAIALTGSPTAVMLPAAAKKHDIQYLFADKTPLEMDDICLTDDQLSVLTRFVRDLKEMLSTAFMKDGPGSLSYMGGAPPDLKTAASAEEIRSFVMVFRRLYMRGEPAAFLKAVSVFTEIIPEHALSMWVNGVASEYKKGLDEPPPYVPRVSRDADLPTRKRLIDIFLYTQYAHQPDQKRTKQFHKCLADVGGRMSLLTWLFLGALWQCSLHICNAGKVIAGFLERYRACHDATPAIVPSVVDANAGIGQLETRQIRQERLFEEAAHDLAIRLWEEEGRPSGGPENLIEQARKHLREALQ